jgi:hypothetical protein
MEKKYPYPKVVEEDMLLFFENLNEKDRRYYAALEARKLGHGGIEYISKLLGIDQKTIRSGISSFKKKSTERPDS